MKFIHFSLFLFFALSANVFSQVINQTMTCPADKVAKVKSSVPGFYHDSEYTQNIKVGENFSTYLLIKVPTYGQEAKAIPNLKIHIPVVPDKLKLIRASLDEVVNLTPGVSVAFANKNYVPGEIVCVKISGIVSKAGTYNPLIKIKATAKVLFEISPKATWSGFKLIVK